MRLISFYDWIRRIYATQDDELACEEVLELLPEYVDGDLAGNTLPRHACEIEQHLVQCPLCYDLYRGLRDAAILEEANPILERVPVERCHPQ